jgi:hypothetical protein
MPPPLPRFTAASAASAVATTARLHRPEFSTATAAAMAGSQKKQSQPPAGVADSIMPHLLNM